MAMNRVRGIGRGQAVSLQLTCNCGMRSTCRLALGRLAESSLVQSPRRTVVVRAETLSACREEILELDPH